MKRCLSLLVVLMMVAGLMANPDMGYAVDEKASEDDCIEIWDIEDLHNVRNHLSGNYILMADLDLSELTSENGLYSYNQNGWLPIGEGENFSNGPFVGTFNGNNHTISGLQISLDNSSSDFHGYAGLFAKNEGRIENLKMSGTSINGKYSSSYIGTISAYNKGTISNVVIENTEIDFAQYTTTKYVGGVVGYNAGEISDAHTIKGNINLDGYGFCIGGIIGYNEAGDIINCSNDMKIDAYGYYIEEKPAEGSSPTLIDTNTSNGTRVFVYEYRYLLGSYRGGIIGRAAAGDIQNCYNMNSVSGETGVIASSSSGLSPTGNGSYQEVRKTYTNKYTAAGIVGKCDSNSQVLNCYNTGEISCNTSDKNASFYMCGIAADGGEVVGCYNIGSILKPVEYSVRNIKPIGGTAASCYYLQNDTTGIQTGATSLNEGQLKSKAFMTSFDFTEIWELDEETSYKYPQLKGNRQDIEKIDHAYGEWVIEKEATCTESGSQYKECACGAKITEEIIKLEHSWKDDYTVDKEATCKEEGAKSIHCSVCDESKDVTVVEKAGHAYGEWVIEKEATCTESGSQYKECACGAKITEEITKLEHSWKVASSDAEEGWKEYQICSRCGYTTYEEIPEVKTQTKEIGQCTISALDSCSYTGKALTPAVTVKDGSIILTNGIDYTVSYSNNINPGTATIIVTGKGNYTGTVKKTFTIVTAPKSESIPAPVCQKDVAITISGITFYMDTKADGTATISKVAKNNKKTIAIKDTVTINGVEYMVMAIDKNAFKNCKKVTKIIIPANVKFIKKNAFTGAKKLKQIVFKGKKSITIKKGAFKGLNTKKIKVTTNKKCSSVKK